MAKRCPACGSTNDDSSRTCWQCGEDLGAYASRVARRREREIRAPEGAGEFFGSMPESKPKSKRKEREMRAPPGTADFFGTMEREAPSRPMKPKKTGLTKINFKIKTRWKEMFIICIAAVFVNMIFKQWILMIGLFLFAFYIIWPSETDVINEARETLRKRMAAEEEGKRKKFKEEDLGEVYEKAKKRKLGELAAEEEYGRYG